MKNKFNKKIICLAAAAIVLTAGVSIKDAMAYFTTYVVSEGNEELKLGFTETEIEETIREKMKKNRHYRENYCQRLNQWT